MARLAIAVCCYASLFSASLLGALLLRFDFEMTTYVRSVFAESVLVVVLLKIAVVLFSRDWRRRLRYSTQHDIAWSAGVCFACGVLVAALQIAHEAVPQIPRSVIAMDTVLSAAALASLRIVAQSLRTLHDSRNGGSPERALIYSDGKEAISILTAIQNGGSRLKIVGIISCSRVRGLGFVAGVPVFEARNGMASIIQQTRAAHVLVPANLSGKDIREITESCVLESVTAHLVPHVDEITEGRFHLKLRDITIDDLLRREPNQLDLNEIRTMIADRVVLITGAAGSIGSEVCRQLLELGPRKLVFLDQSEFGIFQLEQELIGLAKTLGRPITQMEFVLEDIVDRDTMSRIFLLHRPQVVFHAAAYKHVPLMEHNPQSAVRNNVMGTKNLVDLSDEFDVERFVMISTDKAVRPSNVMGATKLIAENYLYMKAGTSRTRFITVRFGNVLNSAGSVVPTFRRQIESGGPVTVTHPEMQRYFMTIPEAVQLVLQSSAIGEGGDVLILDMGEPVRIVDLARDMIHLSGMRCPEDIEIEFTGLRPGEKLYEELFYETEQSAVRVHQKIFRAPRDMDADPELILRILANLTEHLSSNREELRDVLWRQTNLLVERSSGPVTPSESERHAA
jgi:FlaA1/EpsC-like NDP-sugar epimerase